MRYFFPFIKRLLSSRDCGTYLWDNWTLISFSFINRFLVPRDMSVGQFIHILSGRLHLAPGKALFVFVENTLPQTCKTWLHLLSHSCFLNSFLWKKWGAAIIVVICSKLDAICLWIVQRWRWICLHVLQQWENLWLWGTVK